MPSGLSSLKSKLDQLNTGKLETTPVDISKLSDAVKSKAIKKTEYNAKIKDTTLNAKTNDVKAEILSITSLATTIALNAKINEVKDKILSITNLAINTALTAVENKIPNFSNLVKKADYNTKINEIEKKILIMIKVIGILLYKNLIS